MRALIVLALLWNPLVSEAIEPYCRNDLFTSQAIDIKQAKVSATENGRLHFRGDGEGCPDSAQCIRKAYLVAGDKLIVSKSANGWTCGLFFGKKREFVGWLPTRNLEISPVKPSYRLGDWAGIWAVGYGEIRIEPKGRDLEVSGETLGHCRETPYGAMCNEGGFGGKAAPAGDLLTISGDSCTVQMRLVSNYLIVTDNKHCGGMNVSFDGVYRRSGKP